MSFDIYFRSKSSFDVVMKESSEISPVGMIDASSDDGCKNAAIGAVRLSVVGGNNTRKLLWIPAPCVWYDGKNDDLHTNYTGSTANTFKPGGNVCLNGSTVDLTGDGTNEHWYYNASRNRVQVNDSSLVASTDGDYKLGSDITIVSLDNTNYDSTNGYYYNRVRVNLWIEGEDGESRLKFVGGQFNMSLEFDRLETTP